MLIVRIQGLKIDIFPVSIVKLWDSLIKEQFDSPEVSFEDKY